MWDGQPLDGMPPPDRVRLILLDDHTLSNAEVAVMACATAVQAGDVRRRLAGLGVIPPHRELVRRFPQHVPMPRAPRSLMEGLCVGHPGASWWVSDDPGERAQARRVCDGCHVKADCLAWALRAIPASDTSIYGGTTAAARRRLRRALGIVRPNAVAAINARKTCCPECGLPLSGENVIREPGRKPGTVRRRCRACTRARKAAAYRERGRAAARQAEGGAA